MNATDLTECLRILPPSQAVLIQGDTGVGKSQLVHQLSADLGIPLVDVRASIMTEGDMGYPDIEKIKELGMTVFTLPSWYMRAVREPVVLFLDEWNRGLVGVLNGMMQITLDREFGNDKEGRPVRLHPETRVIAAANVGGDFQVTTMDRAHMNRFWLANFVPSTADWLAWARSPAGGVDPMIIEFIQTNEKHLRQKDHGDGTTQEPTQRSWDRFSQALKYRNFSIHETSGQLPGWFYNIATGFVGIPTAQAFIAFIKNYQFQLTPKDIFDNAKKHLDKYKAMPIESRLALIEKINDSCVKDTWDLNGCKNLKILWDVMTGEEKMKIFNGVLASKNTNNAGKFHPMVRGEIVPLVNKANELNESIKNKTKA